MEESRINNVPKTNTTEDPTGSIVSADTVISGDINSTSALKVYGEVKGNVTSTKKVEIYGRINGNISGEKVELIKGNVSGNVLSKSTVDIGSEVNLVGDIKAEDLNAKGRIKGKIEVGKLITLDSSAICEGSITASLINIKTGAKIKGPITVFDNAAKEAENKQVKERKIPTTTDYSLPLPPKIDSPK